MIVEKTPIDGLLVIKPQLFRDNRGYFLETWQKKRYMEAGINEEFVQDNHSVSCKNTLRGLHFQKQHPQGKLIFVSEGTVFDVAVDLRKGSITFGKWFGIELSAANQWQLWVPKCMAHGFVVLSEIAHFHYKCTDYYNPHDEGSIRWNDSDINIEWPIKNPILSQKDAKAPFFKDVYYN